MAFWPVVRDGADALAMRLPAPHVVALLRDKVGQIEQFHALSHHYHEGRTAIRPLNPRPYGLRIGNRVPPLGLTQLGDERRSNSEPGLRGEQTEQELGRELVERVAGPVVGRRAGQVVATKLDQVHA